MVGWNDLPKELKWMIFKHLVIESYYSYRSEKSLGTYAFRKGWRYNISDSTITIITPRTLWMYELFILLSRIDKNRYFFRKFVFLINLTVAKFYNHIVYSMEPTLI